MRSGSVVKTGRKMGPGGVVSAVGRAVSSCVVVCPVQATKSYQEAVTFVGGRVDATLTEKTREIGDRVVTTECESLVLHAARTLKVPLKIAAAITVQNGKLQRLKSKDSLCCDLVKRRIERAKQGK